MWRQFQMKCIWMLQISAGICALLLCLAGIPGTGGDGAAAGCGPVPAFASSNDKELTIEVVEEISVDDQIVIEDGEVPLASFSEAPADAGPRRAVMMGVVFLAVAGYTVYFDRREKRLFELRREAARAQKAGGQR